MSKRTIRRAAERTARKLERKTQLTQLLTAEIPKTMTATASSNNPNDDLPNLVFRDDPDPRDGGIPFDRVAEARARNEARQAANRANSQKSTGPTSDEGRAKSSLNALKHGLTGNTVLLDSDDVDAYQDRLDAHVLQYKPVTFEERRLVQSIHDAAWRLDRILNLESTIYAKGRIELQFCFSELPEDHRKSFVNLEITERNTKQLRNLHIQEARLQKQRARDIAALKQLIKERQAEEKTVAEPTGFVFETPKSNPEQPEIQVTIPLDEAA